MKVLAPTGNQVIKIAARESGTYTLNVQLTNKNTNKLDINAENIDGEDAVFNNGFLEVTLPIQDDFAGVLKEGTFYSMVVYRTCLLYTSPSPRDGLLSRMPSSA